MPPADAAGDGQGGVQPRRSARRPAHGRVEGGLVPHVGDHPLGSVRPAARRDGGFEVRLGRQRVGEGGRRRSGRPAPGSSRRRPAGAAVAAPMPRRRAGDDGDRPLRTSLFRAIRPELAGPRPSSSSPAGSGRSAGRDRRARRWATPPPPRRRRRTGPEFRQRPRDRRRSARSGLDLVRSQRPAAPTSRCAPAWESVGSPRLAGDQARTWRPSPARAGRRPGQRGRRCRRGRTRPRLPAKASAERISSTRSSSNAS